MDCDFVIVGAGIAGASVGAELATRAGDPPHQRGRSVGVAAALCDLAAASCAVSA
jgi:glycine/D-amino acid oxidase-like deaminating enzyme